MVTIRVKLIFVLKLVFVLKMTTKDSINDDDNNLKLVHTVKTIELSYRRAFWVGTIFPFSVGA